VRATATARSLHAPGQTSLSPNLLPSGSPWLVTPMEVKENEGYLVGGEWEKKRGDRPAGYKNASHIREP
jgi:hypothetical protein